MDKPEFVWVLEYSLLGSPGSSGTGSSRRRPAAGSACGSTSSTRSSAKPRAGTSTTARPSCGTGFTTLVRDELATATRKVAELSAVLGEPDGVRKYFKVEVEKYREVPFGPPAGRPKEESP